MNYYQHHIGDFMRDTAYLNATEEGIYRRALDWYYANEKPLPADIKLVCRYLRARDKSEIAAVNVVLAEFFVLTDDGYTQSRCDKEIAAYSGKAETNRVNGQKGGRPKKEPNTIPEKTQSVISGISLETQTKGNQEPRTINQEPLTNLKINNKKNTESKPTVVMPFIGNDLLEFQKVKEIYPEVTEAELRLEAEFHGVDVMLVMYNKIKAHREQTA